MTTSRPMSLWRLEWIRLFRTKRWIALLGVYVFFGLVGPLTARYISEILESFGGDVQVVIPDPVAADGIASYISNAAQIGLLVAVGVAAAALVFDSKPQMGIFLRSRVKSVAAIIAPRYLVATAAIAAAFTVGSIAALYESTEPTPPPSVFCWRCRSSGSFPRSRSGFPATWSGHSMRWCGVKPPPSIGGRRWSRWA